MKKILSLIICFGVLIVSPQSVIASSEARLFDKFGDVSCGDEKARLDNFAIQLQNDAQATGYIIFYGGRRHNYRLPRRGEAEARAARLKPYITNSWVIDRARIVVVNGGYRELWEVELWIVPNGANPPTPTPTVQPQEIRFRRGRARVSDYHCTV